MNYKAMVPSAGETVKGLVCSDHDVFGDDDSVFVDSMVEGMGPCEGSAAWGAQPPLSASPLPCLYIHNGIEGEVKTSAKLAQMSDDWRAKQPLAKSDRKRESGFIAPRERKCAESLFLNAGHILSRGVERCAFVTITTAANHSYWSKEGWKSARKIFHSWSTNKGGLPYVFGAGRDWCRVIEPQRRGAIHWHLLVDVGQDIRTGCDFEAFNRGDYSSAPRALRGLWAKMRDSAKRYGLGRVEIMPVKSEKWEAAARYVGKYISKSIHADVFYSKIDKVARPLHSRRVGFSQGWKVANTNFSWLEHGESWRRGVSLLAASVGAETFDDLSAILGKKWAWNNKQFIQSPDAFLGGERPPLPF